jgi:hypothetical protein
VPEEVERLDRYAIALMKGEKWPGNRGNGLVHRSPRIIGSGQRRVLFKIDSDEPQKSEIRSTKSETNPNLKIRIPKPA